MKVLHLISGGDVGGAKSHVLSLVKELGSNIEVKIITFRGGSFTVDGLSMGINIEILSSKNFFSNILSLKKIIKNEGFDILHSHGSKGNLHCAVLKLLTKIPTITTIHSDFTLDYLHSRLRKYTFGILNYLALKIIDYHICVSNALVKLLLSKGFTKDNIFTIVNGVDFEISKNPITLSEYWAKHKIPLELKTSTTVFGILARLTPVKGIDVFLKAASLVLPKHPDTIFLVAGDGDAREALQNQTSDLGISSNVHFLGHIKDSDDFLSSIDVSVLSSLSEGFPYTILEGARLKKPTISTRVGDIPNLINHYQTGLLCEPGDVDGLAKNMILMIEDSNLRKSLGEAIYIKAKDIYSLDVMCKEQLKIYNEALECPPLL